MITPQNPLIRRAAAPGALALAAALAGLALDAPEARGERAAVSNAVVIQQMELMKSEMQALRRQVNNQELRNAEKDSEIKALRQQVDQNKKDLTSLPSYDFLKDVKMSGYVDATVTETFETPADQFNRLRTFDQNAHSFNNEQFKLTLEKATSEESRAGFRVDMLMGRSGRLLGFATADAPAGTNNLDDFELEQAYVTYKADLGNGVDLYGGKFVTLLGAEVLETPLNWNISRSILFGFAIPFTHTGVRATYAFNDQWNATFGVNNGWDNEDDNNTGYSYEGRIGWIPNDEFSVYVNTMYGPEFAGDSAHDRGSSTWCHLEGRSHADVNRLGPAAGGPFDVNGDGMRDAKPPPGGAAPVTRSTTSPTVSASRAGPSTSRTRRASARGSPRTPGSSR
jgi:hypothetical protein